MHAALKATRYLEIAISTCDIRLMRSSIDRNYVVNIGVQTGFVARRPTTPLRHPYDTPRVQ